MSNIKIVLAEDEPSLGQILKESLETRGFVVYHAVNGEIAYHYYLKKNPDILVLDVMMPKKDGFSLAKDIRANHQQVPIIFLTAKSMEEDTLQGFKVGADDYLNKPFDSEVLLMKIKAIIQRKASEVKPDTTKFEFEIGKFHLRKRAKWPELSSFRT